MSWQLQEAKNRLSQLVQEADQSGPQVITVHGREAAVLISAKDYRKLQGREGSRVDFLRKSPWADSDIPIERDRDTGREVDL
jgi:prevent-host-death family protein